VFLALAQDIVSYVNRVKFTSGSPSEMFESSSKRATDEGKTKAQLNFATKFTQGLTHFFHCLLARFSVSQLLDSWFPLALHRDIIPI
jgi:hypothetical protein